MASLNNPLRHRYWIAFAAALPRGADGPIPKYRSCNVTAYTLDDALYLIREQLTLGRDLPAIDHVIEDIDSATPDAGHIRPNMGEPFWRGVWWPAIDGQGYQRLRYYEERHSRTTNAARVPLTSPSNLPSPGIGRGVPPAGGGVRAVLPTERSSRNAALRHRTDPRRRPPRRAAARMAG